MKQYIQWDICTEMVVLDGQLQGRYASYKSSKEDIMQRCGRLGDAVPPDVELGFHLCYGDYAHHHFKEPIDTANLVAVANAITGAAQRPINWLHLPVPRDRDDDAYFAPLRNLIRPAGTELYLGLIHFTDGAAGAQRRIAAASRVVADFGIATECGLGRRSPETLIDLLTIYRDVADRLSANAG